MMISESSMSMNDRKIAIWLFVVAALVALMVVVGGATRLTGSGLSMVDWEPLVGAIPPLSEADWQEKYTAYQASPEYQLVNRHMGLEDFKGIFWWEFGHRLLGRLIGLVFGLPLLYFIFRKMVRPELKMTLFGLLALGGAQGLLGWYMVQSGLVNEPAVSQYRLAAHLMLALLLMGALMWVGLNLYRPQKPPASQVLRRWVAGLSALVVAQIVMGAFVAGMDAGYVFNDWPTMDGQVVPEGLFASPHGAMAPLEDPMTSQFLHRLGGYILFAMALAFVFSRALKAADPELKRLGHMFGGILMLQVVVGIVTLISVVPVPLGVLHQFFGVLIFAGAIGLANRAGIGAS